MRVLAIYLLFVVSSILSTSEWAYGFDSGPMTFGCKSLAHVTDEGRLKNFSSVFYKTEKNDTEMWVLHKGIFGTGENFKEEADHIKFDKEGRVQEFSKLDGKARHHYSFAYDKDGKCKILRDRVVPLVKGEEPYLRSDIAMCKEIKNFLMREWDADSSCVKQCSSKLELGLADIFKKHKTGMPDIKDMRFNYGVNLPGSPAALQATIYLKRCNEWPYDERSRAELLAPKVTEAGGSSANNKKAVR